MKSSIFTKMKLYTEYIEYLSQYNPDLLKMDTEDIKQLVTDYTYDKMSEWIDIKDDKLIVGFMIISTNPNECRPDVDYEIAQMYISSDHRRKGLGRRVVFDYLSTHPGIYSLDIYDKNHSASVFWNRVFRDVKAKQIILREIRTDAEFLDKITLYGYEVG